jgi:hypothetical protein
MKKEAVVGIIKEGLSIRTAKRDVMIDEAIKQMGEEGNRTRLYVATHGKGGSDRYTTPSTVIAFSNKSEQFRIFSQCQVQPGKFRTHTSLVNVSKVWDIVNPAA